MIKARNIVSQVSFKISKLKFPERLKGGRIEKWADYWVTVGKDYKEASLEIANDCKRKPMNALAYCFGVCGVIYAIYENPDKTDFKDILQRNLNASALLSSKIRSKEVDSQYNFFMDCFNHNLIRRFSFGVASILWIDDYSRECGLFETQCSYLRPQYLTFHDRVVDIGFLGRWWNISQKSKVFDINEDEWTDKLQTPPTENQCSN